jgi:hypothetical protein
MAFFHIRLPNSPGDFMLLSPLDDEGVKVGEGGLKSYRAFDGDIHWYFCSQCGVRCFAFMGEGDVRDVDVDVGDGDGEKKVRAWTPKREGCKEGLRNGCYFTLNASTV